LPPPSQPTGSDPADRTNKTGAFSGGTYFLGRYRVVDEIGVGGMASVHLARVDGPGGFQKWIAIKRIHPHLVEDDTFVNMFLDEARVAARISHPNVATVFELGRHENTYWIAMEYLHGEPVREIMRRTLEVGAPMPPEIACRVIADAAEGLHAAHELLGNDGEKLGLVHRDVTPHNLFVTYDGNTKVVDFGIAKFSSRMASTRAGTLKGKLAYMSPEQVAGHPIDRRTDVFALGVVLWELTTGQRLFRMDNDLDTLAKVQECRVPLPSTLVAGYPSDLEAVALKALAKDPAQRYRTARELSRALQSLLMRRGLFVASDELAAYMASVFGDRIERREAHLRWAAEVTQTIDLDKVTGLPPSPWQAEDRSILTFNSEVQHSQPVAAGSSFRNVRPESGAGAGTPSFPESASLPAPASAAVPPPSLQSTQPIGSGPLAAALAVEAASAEGDDDPATIDDPPTLARPRGMGDDLGIPAAFDTNFEDGCDTIVNEPMPDLEEMHAHPGAARSKRADPDENWGAARSKRADPDENDPPAPLGTTATQAASPSALASSRPVVFPPTPPMATIVQPARLLLAASGGAAKEHTRTGITDAHVAFGQMLTLPLKQPPLGPPPMAPTERSSVLPLSHPSRSELATITARPPGRRVPLWVVAVGSAAAGLTAFAVVVIVLSSLRHRAPAPTAESKGAASGPSVVTRPPPDDDTASSTPADTGAVPAPQAGGSVASARTQPSSAAARAAPSASAPSASASSGSAGTLKVLCVPACDQVFDNGVMMGPSPILRRSASLGTHRVKLVWSDASKVISVVVVADQTALVRESHP
jgi:serine/threonine-protein kinase